MHRAISTTNKGRLSEKLASEYLGSRGYEIIKTNFYAKKLGEIDIIATKDGVWHFIEVKSSKGSFNPIYNITLTKLNRLIRSVEYYIQRYHIDAPYTLDAIIVHPSKIEFIPNITL